MLHSSLQTLKELYHSVRRGVLNFGNQIAPDFIWVLGNQRSGTTAIARLIAEYGGLSYCVDFRPDASRASADMYRIYAGEFTPEELLDKYRHCFSRELIKEPELTFLYETMRSLLPTTRRLFIIRDPRQNIRSVLDHVDLPGDRSDLDIDKADLARSCTWKWIMTNRHMGLPGNQYIERLAFRWCAAVDVYLQHPEEFILLQYETFLADKTGAISRVCNQMQVEKKNDICELVDIFYQRQGNRGVEPTEFFSDANYRRILDICTTRMDMLGYAH